MRPPRPLGKSQPRFLDHTKALADVGIIRGEKEGRWVWWSVVPERLDALLSRARILGSPLMQNARSGARSAMA